MKYLANYLNFQGFFETSTSGMRILGFEGVAELNV